MKNVIKLKVIISNNNNKLITFISLISFVKFSQIENNNINHIT